MSGALSKGRALAVKAAKSPLAQSARKKGSAIASKMTPGQKTGVAATAGIATGALIGKAVKSDPIQKQAGRL